MDIEILRSFLAVVDVGGFSKAEKRVNRAQSTISRHIGILEDRLERRLLDRDNRNFTLTKYGERYVEYARRIVALDDEARAAMNMDANMSLIRVGIPEDFFDFSLPTLLQKFAKQEGDITLSIIAARSFVLRKELQAGRLDLALLKEEKMRDGGHAYWIEELKWVVKGRRPVPAEQPVPLICFPPGCPYRNRATAALDSCGISWHVAFEGSNWPGIKAAVENDLGVALLAEVRTIQGLSEPEGFPEVDPIYLVLRTKEVSPRGALRRLVDRLVSLVPQVRIVSDVPPRPDSRAIHMAVG